MTTPRVSFDRLLISALTLAIAGPALAAERPLPAYLDPTVAPEVTSLGLFGGGGDGEARPETFLSVSLSLGLKPDMASLGQTITQDGTVDTAGTTMASLLYATDKALMSDRDNLAIWHNSQNTSTPFKMLGAEPVLGGPLLGLDLGGTLQVELDRFLHLPLFVRTGFHYATRIAGGHQERTLGNVASDFIDVAILLNQKGENADDYVGGKMVTEYDAAWYEVPLSVGFLVRMHEHGAVYASFGLSYFSGGFSVRLDVDEKYANVLATHIIDSGGTLPDVVNLSPGAVQDTVTFDMSGMGINYGLGAQADLGHGLVWYLELNGSGAAKTVYSSDLAPKTQQLLTATSSASLAQADPHWFKRLAFPVVVGGGTVRTGLRLYLY